MAKIGLKIPNPHNVESLPFTPISVKKLFFPICFHILLRLWAVHAKLNSVLTVVTPRVRRSLKPMFCLISPKGASTVLVLILYFFRPASDRIFSTISSLKVPWSYDFTILPFDYIVIWGIGFHLGAIDGYVFQMHHVKTFCKHHNLFECPFHLFRMVFSEVAYRLKIRFKKTLELRYFRQKAHDFRGCPTITLSNVKTVYFRQ